MEKEKLADQLWFLTNYQAVIPETHIMFDTLSKLALSELDNASLAALANRNYFALHLFFIIKEAKFVLQDGVAFNFLNPNWSD